jgi:membrane-associated phospholipid phosphatase
MATSVAVLRIRADRHYTTDVLAGALIGTSTGFLLPKLGHYWFELAPERATAGVRWSAAPLVGSTWGAVLFGSL